jgi:hypothetical protein
MLPANRVAASLPPFGTIFGMAADDYPALQALFDRLEVQVDDERAVISLISAASEADQWQLRFGSVLIGPEAMSRLTWNEWSRDDRRSDRPTDLSMYGVQLADWREFDFIQEGWRYTRFSCSPRDAADLVAGALGHGRLKTPASPPVLANLGSADAFLRLFPKVETGTSLLAAQAGRPVVGWFHPLTEGAESQVTDFPREVSVEPGRHGFDLALLLLGLCPKSMRGLDAPQGLLVGRLRSDAWIADARGARPDLQTFDVQLRLVPTQISLWELELDLEEMNDHGELISARRLRLADIELPEHGADNVTVKMPTIGRRVTRRLRLYDTGGRLLDAAERVRLVESIHLSVGPFDGEPTVSVIGDDTSPSLVRRLADLDRSEQEYAAMLQAGATDRVVSDQASGRAGIAKRLAAARGELLIFDPYFGNDADDWGLLRSVACPIRVLTSARVGTNPPPELASNVLVRGWRASKGQRLPFHDRGYLWDGAGISVGTSPNGLGQRLSVVDTVEPAVVALLQRHFEIWWADGRAAPLP